MSERKRPLSPLSDPDSMQLVPVDPADRAEWERLFVRGEWKAEAERLRKARDLGAEPRDAPEASSDRPD